MEKPQFMKPNRLEDDTYHRFSGYRPTLSDFIEGPSFAGIADHIDLGPRLQEPPPSALYSRPQPRARAPINPLPHRPMNPLTTMHSEGVFSLSAPYLPTPPRSPYPFAHSQTSHHLHVKQRNLAPCSSLSIASNGKHSVPSFATPMPQISPLRCSGFLDTSLLQAMEFDASPDKFVLPDDDNTDPFIDQPEDNIPGSSPSIAPSPSLSAHPPFQPSRALLDIPRQVDPRLANIARQVGIDLQGNYKGDITQDHIFNAMAPMGDNCALHVISLPPNVSLKEIFSVIIGKVFSFQLHDPVPGKWTGCGARLVFTNRAAAEEFYWRARTGLGITIRGQQIRVLWNRDPCRPQQYADRRQSRVLQIKGPNIPSFSAEAMEHFFASKLLFKLVERKEWFEAGGVKVVELHFPSILGQSRPAMKQFYDMLDETDQRSVFKIQYGPDPCEPTVRSINLLRDLRV